MNKTQKILACLNVLIMLGLALSAEDSEKSISFTNELGSDNLITISKDNTAFCGFYDEITVDGTSKYVDAGIDATLILSADDNGTPEGFEWDEDAFDWYVTVKPFETLAVGLSSDFYFPGSYLVVADDNVSEGNMGGDGVTFAYTGISGLTLATSFGSDTESGKNWFYLEDEGENTYFDTSFGAEYSFGETGSIGAVVHDIANSETRNFGAYTSFTGVEGMEMYAGYAYNGQDDICGVSGDQLINFSLSYMKDMFGCGADYVTDTGNQFYTGLTAGYNITDPVNISLSGTLNAEYNSISEGTFCLMPTVTYTNDSIGSVSFLVNIMLSDGAFNSVSFPVYWDYSF